MKPSPYQEAIYEAVRNTTDNLMVEAVAGSGKTTTIVEAAKLIPHHKSALFLAYNKSVAEELNNRLPPNVKARTLHSIGYGICKMNFDWFKSNDQKVRNIYYYTINDLDKATPKEKQDIFYNKDDILQYVSLLKAYCVENNNDYEKMLPYIASHYDLPLPDGQFAKDLQATFIESIKYTKVIDFDDMVYFPAVLKDIKVNTYDVIFVDEAQDLSPIQAMFINKLLSPGGRVIFVGDRHQAIYGFRGANTNSIQTLTNQYSCKTLPLSISYRCSKAVVNHARVSCTVNIEPSDTAINGSVTDCPDYLENLKPSDFLICRTVGPLQNTLTQMVKREMPINFMYGDLLTDLGELTAKIKAKHNVISPKYIDQYISVKQDEYYARKKKRQADELGMKGSLLTTIVNLFPGESTYEHIFGSVLQNPHGTKLMSCHKAKGLEAERVFILNPQLMPHPKATQPWEMQQEENLKYVAITRAKQDLIYCRTEDDD